MNSYRIQIEVPEGEVKRLLDKITDAQDTIGECYQKLEELGVLVIKENPSSGN